MTRLLIPGLAIAIIILGGIFGAEMAFDGSGTPVPPPSLSQSSMVHPTGITSPVDVSPAWITSILARPLFNTDRRPVAGAVATGGPTEGLPRLTGVMVTPGGRQAIFAASVGGRQIAVAVGGHIGVFTVSRIDESGITVLGPDGPRQIRPSFAVGAEAAANAPDASRLQQPGPAPLGLDLLRSIPNTPIPAAPRR